MVFSSPIFLFYFLPSLIALYFIAPKGFKNTLLLSASLLFYAWGEGFYVALMIASIGLNYLFGLLIHAYRSNKLWIGLGIAANLAILISYKYANFLVDNLNVLLTSIGTAAVDLEPVHLPLGISFFTFQAMSYLIDIHRGQITAQRNPLNLGLYIAMFPQLVAGPIVRYSTIMASIVERQVTPKLFLSGAERFTIGLAKKMLIANPLGAVVDTLFALPAESLPTHVAWFAILLYALQIYFDFSGYSDMAIGLGRMFGFRFLENFNYPYVAQSLQDFWRRWHISLSTWFRDYLYIPLGGNRVSPVRTYFNLFTVFFLCGLWHGASWNFLVWGAFHGVILALERAGLANIIARLWRPLRHGYLLFVVLISWVFFRAETLSDANAFLARMFALDFSSVPFELFDVLNLQMYAALIAGLIFSVSWNLTSLRDALPRTIILVRGMSVALLLLIAASQLAVATHNPFIYFRF